MREDPARHARSRVVLTDASELPAKMRPLIKARENAVFVSAASRWEIAIKVRSGKWIEAAGLVPGIADVLNRAKFTPLPVTVQHAERAGLLDLDHNDPFDRLLAAQALDEGLVVASVDPVFRRIAGLTVGCNKAAAHCTDAPHPHTAQSGLTARPLGRDDGQVVQPVIRDA